MDWIGVFAAFGILAVLVYMLRPGLQHKEAAPPLADHITRAEKWLESQGFHIIRRRQEAEWVGYYDQDEYRKRLSVDFIARKGADYYGVKVTQTPNFEVSGLRLREEWFPMCRAFGVKGILHLDVSEGASHTFDFELRTPRYVWVRRACHRCGWILTGALATFAWLHRIS